MSFKFLITITPLGLMYGSAGGFLSPENLVGRSGIKFPPDAATLSGLFFSLNTGTDAHENLKWNLYTAGPFWAQQEDPEDFYVPIPWHRIIADDGYDEWRLENNRWQRGDREIEPDYQWQRIGAWERSTQTIRSNQEVAQVPWNAVPMLHPKTKPDERHVVEEDGLFLEYAMQMDDEYCIVYLSTHALPDGWYRFGGEGHLVELKSMPLDENSQINKLLSQPIQRAFSLITPGIWGSKKLSYRYPKHPDFPRNGLRMLTDRPSPHRYRIGHEDRDLKAWSRRAGRLSRGRYAVPAGSVYVLPTPLDQTHQNWWNFNEAWFPREGFPLKHVGCSLCLPITVQGVD
jgi:CRISPR-associated protein Cmr3